MDNQWQLCRTIGPLTLHSQEIWMVLYSTNKISEQTTGFAFHWKFTIFAFTLRAEVSTAAKTLTTSTVQVTKKYNNSYY